MNAMMSKFTSFLMKVAFVFEPIASPFITLYVKRTLGKLKENGKLDKYRVKTKRMKKFHYKIDLNIDMTPEQTRTVLQSALFQLLTKLRR